jgi:hypothetical protein
MRLGDLPESALRRRLREAGLTVQVGPFVTRLRSRLPVVARGLRRLYADHPVLEAPDVPDFAVEVRQVGGLRRWVRRQSQFYFEGEAPFLPLPIDQGFASFEWGLNWCVANHAHEYLIIHAAVLEREGRALLMPAPPGSGKSTLCAALVSQGWRLLSDELALVSTTDGTLAPIPRPVTLKNESIPALLAFAPDAELGETVAGTRKGTVAHMRPPPDSVARWQEAARAAWVVFPAYRPGAATALAPLGRGRAFMRTAESTFNYNVLGTLGFDLLADAIDACECFTLTFSNLADATRQIEERLGASASTGRVRVA